MGNGGVWKGWGGKEEPSFEGRYEDMKAFKNFHRTFEDNLFSSVLVDYN